MDLKNKVVVVIGATGGIGREIVKELQSEGANLILVAKNKRSEEYPGKFYECDLSDQKNTMAVSNQIANDYKVIDILINAAGIGIYKPFEELSIDEWNNSIDVNLNSVFIFTKQLISSLNASESSMVLSLGSGMGVKPEAQRSAYCASKFALRGLMLTLAEEYKRFKKPEFFLLTLGSVLTSFGPMSFEEKKKEMESGKGYLTPDWVAKKIIELLKLEKREVEYEFSSPDYNKI